MRPHSVSSCGRIKDPWTMAGVSAMLRVAACMNKLCGCIAILWSLFVRYLYHINSLRIFPRAEHETYSFVSQDRRFIYCSLNEQSIASLTSLLAIESSALLWQSTGLGPNSPSLHSFYRSHQMDPFLVFTINLTSNNTTSFYQQIILSS